MFKPEDRFAESSLASTIRRTNEGAAKQIRVVPTDHDGDDDDHKDISNSKGNKYQTEDEKYNNDEGDILI